MNTYVIYSVYACVCVCVCVAFVNMHMCIFCIVSVRLSVSNVKDSLGG